MLIGSRSGFVTLADREDEMYKELFEQFVTNTFPQGYELVIPYHFYRINIFNAIVLDTLTFSEMTSQEFYSFANQIAADYGGGTNSAWVRVLKFPRFTYWGYYYRNILGALYGLEHLYIPNVTSFQDTAYGFHGYRGDLLRVHIDKTCSDIKTLPNFPGFNETSLALDKIVFVGSDGTVAWDGTDWTITQNANGGGHKCLNSSLSPLSRSSRLWKEAA